MRSAWFEKSHRRCLVDMHIADWDERFLSKISPKKYAEMMELSGADTAIICAASCLGLCYWPTRRGHAHGQLKGRDLFGELARECRKKKLNVVGYFNIWSRWAHDAHPEWRLILPNGKSTVENGWRFGLCCQNTGFFDYVMDMIGELCSGYEMDGLWVDMIGWFSQVCVCEGCKKRFLRETGRKLPDTIDWENDDWVLFQRKREEWLSDFAEAVVAAAKKASPGISVALQNTSMLGGWGGGIDLRFTQQGDYLAGDFYGDGNEISFVCKLLNSLSRNRPIEFMTSRCENLELHTTNKSADRLMMQACAAAANNACFVLIDAIDPEGTLDENFYQTARRVFQLTRKHEKNLSPEAEPVADVAIYYSFESMLDPSLNGKKLSEFKADTKALEKMKTMVRTLAQSHVPFTFATKKDLPALSKFKMIMLPNTMRMDEEECAAFREYVKSGGALYASGEASLYGKTGGRRKDFQLADVFGVSLERAGARKMAYASPARKSALSGFCSEKYPIQLNGPLPEVRALEGTEILATTTLPFTDPSDKNLFSSAISNPPGIATQSPALTRRKYGKGLAVYSTGELESHPFEPHREAFAALARSVMKGRASFETDAPRQVELTLFRDRKKKRLIVNMLNYQETLPPMPAREITVRISLEGETPESLTSVTDGRKIPYSRVEKNSIEFKVDELEMYRMFVLTHK